MEAEAGSDSAPPFDSSTTVDVAVIDDSGPEACVPPTTSPTVVDVSTLGPVPVISNDAAIGAIDPAPRPQGIDFYFTATDERRPGAMFVSDGGFSQVQWLPVPSSPPCDASTCLAAVAPAALLAPGSGGPGESFALLGEVYPVDQSQQPKENWERGAIVVGLGFTTSSAYPTRGFHWSDEDASPAKFDIRSIPALADCVSYARPAPWIATPSPAQPLDVAVTCRTKSGSRIVGLRTPDRGQTWTFLGNLLTEQDLAALGSAGTVVDGPQIFDDASSNHYLSVGTRASASGPYDGCTTVALAKTNDHVERACGAPVVVRRLVEKNGLPLGACAFSTTAGYSAAVLLAPGAIPRERLYVLGITTP